jgi:predicted transcriptional regulator
MNHFESGIESGVKSGEEKSDANFEKLKPDMRMQVDLALKFYGISKEDLNKEDLNSYVLKWVEYDNSKFPKEFRRVLTEHPELLTEYQTEPESALNKMENMIGERVNAHKE